MTDLRHRFGRLTVQPVDKTKLRIHVNRAAIRGCGRRTRSIFVQLSPPRLHHHSAEPSIRRTGRETLSNHARKPNKRSTSTSLPRRVNSRSTFLIIRLTSRAIDSPTQPQEGYSEELQYVSSFVSRLLVSCGAINAILFPSADRLVPNSVRSSAHRSLSHKVHHFPGVLPPV